MKTKILIIMISFIFLLIFFSINIEAYANFSGAMYIDSPVNNTTIIRPDETNIKIAGWAVSNDVGASVRVFIDGKLLSNNASRTKRGDVDKVISPSYGGVQNTPNAGFYYILDNSNLQEGIHVITAQHVSRYGQILNVYETYINIQNKQIKGDMYLDTPICNQIFTKPNEVKLKLAGWAVSNDNKATLRIFVNEKLISSNITRTKRGDVDKIIAPSYGGVEMTPNAGFESTLDITKWQNGNYKIRIEQMSRYGEMLCSYMTSINVQTKEFKGDMYIDIPIYNQTYIRPSESQIKLEGWAVSDDDKAFLKIFIDGNLISTNIIRTKRGDVDKIISPSYGGVETTPMAGFSCDLDISNLQIGNHKIKVEQVTRYGELLCANETCINIENKQFYGTMYLEKPANYPSFTRPDDAKIRVEGWAVSNDSNANLKIYIDDKIIETNITRVKRRDVDSTISMSYGGAECTPNAGFYADVDISNLEGETHHILKVEQISSNGTCMSVYQSYFKIVNKKFEGTMYIDSPVYNTKILRSDGTQIKIEGWAVSNDANATVRILIDDNIVVNNAQRIKRGDVDQIVSPLYGGNKITVNAGFLANIAISGLSEGIHKIRAEEISRYGEIIVAYETIINIENKKYLGEMCIDTPTYSQIYTKGENIAISGWAVAEDENAIIEIYIDDVFKDTASRYQRSDVFEFFEKYGAKTLNPGFGKMISSSNLNAGTHKLTIYEKSRYGDIIATVHVPFVIKNPVSSNPNNENIDEDDDYVDTTPNVTPSTQVSGTKGIDVSQYQGTIDWQKVASSGIKYAMIRVGYRGYGTGGFAEDPKFKVNFQNAVANRFKGWSLFLFDFYKYSRSK